MLESFIDISDLKKAQDKLKEQGKQLIHSLRQQEILSELSMIFNGTEEFDVKIDKILEKIGTTVQVSRVYIFEELPDQKHISNTYEWCNSQTASSVYYNQKYPIDNFSEIIDKLDNDGVIMAADIMSLSQDINEIFRQNCTKSTIIFPITISETQDGFIAMDDCSHYREWSKNETELLKTVAGIISNAYRRNIAEKNLIESEETNFALISAVPDNLFHMDFEGRFLNYKGSKQDELLLPPDQFINKKMTDIFPPEFAANQMIAIKECMKKGDATLEYSIPINNVESYFEARFERVNDRELICLVRNISEQKKYETELMEARLKADEANRSKSEFLANMSHEIRTPLNAILGFAESLQTKITNPAQKTLIETIYASGQVLLSLINDILDLSKIEANKLEINPEPVYFPSIITEIQQIFKQKVDDKGIELIVQIEDYIPPALILDEIRLRQILLNIVGNAIKFTEKGYVRILVEGNNQGNVVDLKITVEDTGIGIKKDQMDAIFNAFKQQSGQSTRKYGGTGLGLAICKKLVEKMEGYIQVISKEDRGSAFVIRLPQIKITSSSKITQPKEPEKEIVEFEPATVLITDDIHHNIDAIESLLDDHNLKFIRAYNGEEAIDILENTIPDVIIMDIRMPEKDGIEATYEIRQNERLKNIPIIAYTASIIDFGHHSSRNQFNSVLPKPASKAQIIEELKKYLRYKVKLDQPKEISESKNGSLQGIDNNKLKIITPLIDSKYIDNWKSYRDNLLIDEIEELALNLNHLANQYEINELKLFTEKLLVNISAFEVDGIQNMLQDFGEWTKNFKEITCD
ncbi:MAG: ATP-binding protein [Bacteroidales bacterium]|nr:ATP-binding protein [Bacteroidales bacterium]